MAKEYYNVFIKAVLAGLMIGFGCIIYIMCPNRIVGAFLFSFGLMTIVCRELYLYTGKIGYIREVGVVNILITILGNFVGTFLLGSVIKFTRIAPDITDIVTPKLDDSPLSIFVLAMACGVMMYLAVDSYKKSRAWIFVILPIAIFILSGFEHSIANMCYFTIAGVWSLHTLLWVLIMILGNAVGSWILNLATWRAE